MHSYYYIRTDPGSVNGGVFFSFLVVNISGLFSLGKVTGFHKAYGKFVMSLENTATFRPPGKPIHVIVLL